jgi:hypothetical protein
MKATSLVGLAAISVMLSGGFDQEIAALNRITDLLQESARVTTEAIGRDLDAHGGDTRGFVDRANAIAAAQLAGSNRKGGIP